MKIQEPVLNPGPDEKPKPKIPYPLNALRLIELEKVYPPESAGRIFFIE
jgi:hypothetical protein